MKLSTYQQIFTYNTSKLILFAFSCGFGITYGEALRTPEEQEIYIKNGTSECESKSHLNALGIDLKFYKEGRRIIDPEELSIVFNYWKTLHPNNLISGHSNFYQKDEQENGMMDVPHFEMIVD